MALFGLIKKKSSTTTGNTSADDVAAIHSSAATSLFLDMHNWMHATLAYRRCSPLQWALMTRAAALKNAKLELLDTRLDITEDYAKGIEADAIREKLHQPNDYENWHTFRGKIDTYKSLYGYALIYKEGVIGMPAYKAESWHVFAPFELVPKYKNPNALMFDNEIIYFDGSVVGRGVVPPSEVLIIKSAVPDPSNRYTSRPEIEAIAEPIANIIVAYEARNSLMSNRGAMGIMSPKDGSQSGMVIPKLEQEIKQMRDQYYVDYGVTRGKSPIYFANRPMDYTATTMNVRELGVFDEVKDSIERICDATQVSMNLISNSKGTTFSNVEASERALYTRYAIPIDKEFYSMLSTSEWMGLQKPFEIVSFYDHVEALQQGELQKAQAMEAKIRSVKPLYDDNLVTYNAFLTMIELPEIEEGDVLKSDREKLPLAQRIGVGGTQSLSAILADPLLTDDQKRNTLMILFDLSENDANRLAYGTNN